MIIQLHHEKCKLTHCRWLRDARLFASCAAQMMMKNCLQIRRNRLLTPQATRSPCSRFIWMRHRQHVDPNNHFTRKIGVFWKISNSSSNVNWYQSWGCTTFDLRSTCVNLFFLDVVVHASGARQVNEYTSAFEGVMRKSRISQMLSARGNESNLKVRLSLLMFVYRNNFLFVATEIDVMGENFLWICSRATKVLMQSAARECEIIEGRKIHSCKMRRNTTQQSNMTRLLLSKNIPWHTRENFSHISPMCSDY